MSKCNEIATEYIAALSNQIDFLAAWDMAALGALLATAFGLVLHNHANPDKIIHVRYGPLWFSVSLIAFSLIFSYLATNALTQAIPEICLHQFGPNAPSLKDESDLYRSSVYLMWAQYFSFVLATFSTIVLIVINKRILHKSNNAGGAVPTLTSDERKSR